MALLEVTDLVTHFRTDRGIVQAVNGVSFTLGEGRTLGVVGESGSGKSVLSRSMLKHPRRCIIQHSKRLLMAKTCQAVMKNSGCAILSAAA